MKFFEIIYNNSINSKNNRFLIILILSSIFIATIFFVILFLFRFDEVYKANGIIVPALEDNITTNFDSYIENNKIKIGKKYIKGEILAILSKDEIERELASSKKELNYYLRRKNISKSILSKLEIDELNLKIETIKNKINNLNDQVKENIVKAPYSCSVVSSNIKYRKNGFIPKGTVICNIVSNEKSFVKTTIETSLIGKIIKKQKSLIKVKKRRFKIKGEVDNVELGKNGENYFQDIYISLNEKVDLPVGMEVEVEIIMANLSIKDFFLEIFDIF